MAPAAGNLRFCQVSTNVLHCAGEPAGVAKRDTRDVYTSLASGISRSHLSLLSPIGIMCRCKMRSGCGAALEHMVHQSNKERHDHDEHCKRIIARTSL